MVVTISTHNGSRVARDHNLRNPNVVGKERHIDPDGVSEVWHDERPQDAYRRLFGVAQENYNAKQKRADRRIEDYYHAICNDKKKHAVYEMIVAIGSRENAIDDVLGRQILRDFVDGWSQRNPNLEMVGAYYHADEDGVPHVHIDYIPVAHGYKRGMETQSALVKALEQQGGYEKDGKETAQIQWERQENTHLERLCKAVGIDVDHPCISGRRHLDTAVYRAQKALQTTEKKLEQRKKELKCLGRPMDTLDWVKQLSPQKTLTGGVKGISFDDVIQLIKLVKNGVDTALRLMAVQRRIEELETENKRLNRLILPRQTRFQWHDEESRLKKIEAAFNTLPREVQELAQQNARQQEKRLQQLKKATKQER